MIVTINGHNCEIKRNELGRVSFYVEGIFQVAFSQTNTRHWMLTFDKFVKDISQIIGIEEEDYSKDAVQYFLGNKSIEASIITGHGIMNNRIKPKHDELFYYLMDNSQDLENKILSLFHNNNEINVISSEHQKLKLRKGGE